MQQSVMNMPCTGQFNIQVDKDEWEICVVTREGAIFYLIGGELYDEPTPIMDLNSGVILDIPQFMWDALKNRIMDMMSAEKIGGTMPYELPNGIN